jgi:hypothetical protein
MVTDGTLVGVSVATGVVEAGNGDMVFSTAELPQAVRTSMINAIDKTRSTFFIGYHFLKTVLTFHYKSTISMINPVILLSNRNAIQCKKYYIK